MLTHKALLYRVLHALEDFTLEEIGVKCRRYKLQKAIAARYNQEMQDEARSEQEAKDSQRSGEVKSKAKRDVGNPLLQRGQWEELEKMLHEPACTKRGTALHGIRRRKKEG